MMYDGNNIFSDFVSFSLESSQNLQITEPTRKLASALLFQYHKDILAAFMQRRDLAEQILKEFALKQEQSPAFHLRPAVSLADHSHNCPVLSHWA